MVCRAGGEEFTLVLPDTPLETARAIGERIREHVADTEIPGVGRLTISIGVACQGDEAVTPESLLKRADECLYRAKEGGRNRVEA
ncbi:putative diguanylate cyclase YdaM [compost metagenome]